MLSRKKSLVMRVCGKTLKQSFSPGSSELRVHVRSIAYLLVVQISLGKRLGEGRTDAGGTIAMLALAISLFPKVIRLSYLYSL